MMSDWIVSLEGTEAGEQVALMLALTAAFLHAVSVAVCIFVTDCLVSGAMATGERVVAALGGAGHPFCV